MYSTEERSLRIHSQDAQMLVAQTMSLGIRINSAGSTQSGHLSLIVE